MPEPRRGGDGGIADNAIILEFKIRDPEEGTLEAKGFSPEWIKKYGFAFEGKKVLIKE